MARCEGENRYGRQCGSNALPGSKYCKDHQEQGKHKDKKKTQSISRIPKVRYILIVVLLVLLIISGYFIFSQKENAFFDCKNSAFSSSGVYISGIEARNSKLVSPVINLKINISKSLKQFSLEAKCSEFQKTYLKLGNCDNTYVKRFDQIGENVEIIHIPLHDQKSVLWDVDAIGNAFLFPFDQYNAKAFLGGKGVVLKCTIDENSFKSTIETTWDEFNATVKIRLFRSFPMIVISLAWWLVITIITFIYAWKRPKSSETLYGWMIGGASCFLSIFGIRGVMTAHDIIFPTLLDFLFFASFFGYIAIIFWPFKYKTS